MLSKFAPAVAGVIAALAFAVPAASASTTLHCSTQKVVVAESKTGVLVTSVPDLKNRFLTLVNGRSYEVTSESASGRITLNTRQGLPKGPASLTFVMGSCPRV